MTETRVSLPRLRAWSYQRQRLGRANTTAPLDALRDVVAVYSSHPTAPLSLIGRSRSFGARDFKELEERRQIVRLPAMRLSIFLLPVATAPRVFAATRIPLEKHARRLRYAGISFDEYGRLKRRVLEHAREPVSVSNLRRALEISGSLTTAMRVMSYEGDLLRVGASLRTDNLRYVATEAWLGRPLEDEDPARSLEWLAMEYLRGYGPARVEDFAWWAGIAKGRARSVLEGADVIDVGDGLLLPRDLSEDFERVEPVTDEAIDVLPKWDAYTMGHAPDGRRRLVDDEHLEGAYSEAGDGLPLVLRGGRAVASWSQRFQGERMLVRVVPFEDEAIAAPLYEPAFQEIGGLLGASAVEVVLEDANARSFQ